MNIPDRDLTEDEIRQACRHCCALVNVDPDMNHNVVYKTGADGNLVQESEPFWMQFKQMVVNHHSLSLVLQKVYQDAERRAK